MSSSPMQGAAVAAASGTAAAAEERETGSEGEEGGTGSLLRGAHGTVSFKCNLTILSNICFTVK